LPSPKKIELKDFARDVERLCDFLLDKMSIEHGRIDSVDQRVIHDLKDKAADIQFDRIQVVSETLSGLADYMKGDTVP
jgi:predicted Ser/Thr protein kinase